MPGGSLRVVFMGTPHFAVPSLEALASTYEVALVVTRPDAVRGRGRALEASPVKVSAIRLGLPVLEASRITSSVVECVQDAAPDMICVAAFGCILPDELLAVPTLDAINVHASLLPRWRGAAPIERAILAGDELQGVSIMRVAHDLDAGPWCRQASIPAGDKNATEIASELATLGASELICAIEEIEAGTAVWHEQESELVTLAPKLSKKEMKLDPADDALSLARRVRASGDTAPARCTIGGRAVRVCEAQIAEVSTDELPAQGVASVDEGRLLLGCADGAIECLRVRPEGRREMDARAFVSGLRENELTWERL